MTAAEIIYEIGELGGTSTRKDSDYFKFLQRAQRQICQRFSWSFMHQQRQITITTPSYSQMLGSDFKTLSTEKSPISYQDPTNPNTFPIPCEVISRARADRCGYNPWVTPYPTQLNAFPLRYVFIEYDANQQQLSGISINAGGTGYKVGDVVTLMITGGVPLITSTVTASPSYATITVLTIGGGGSIATFSITNPGIYTTVGTTATSTGGSGTGATWQSATWIFRGWTLNLPMQYAINPTVTFFVSAYWYPADLVLGTDSNSITNHPILAEALVNLTKALAYRAEDVADPRGQAAMALYQEAYESAAYPDKQQALGGRSLRM